MRWRFDQEYAISSYQTPLVIASVVKLGQVQRHPNLLSSECHLPDPGLVVMPA